jgi:hypothetical protein
MFIGDGGAHLRPVKKTTAACVEEELDGDEQK